MLYLTFSRRLVFTAITSLLNVRSRESWRLLSGVKGHPDVKNAVIVAAEQRKARRGRVADNAVEDGAEVVDLLASDEQFI